MRRSLTPLVALAALLGAPVIARAIAVPLDYSTRLHISGSAASVVVGNPAIADVTVVDSHTLYVQGRGLGSTNVIVLDRAGRTLFADDVLVGSPGAHVTVYHGADRDDFACSPRCTSSTPALTPQAKLAGALAEVMSSKTPTSGAAASPFPIAPAASAP